MYKTIWYLSGVRKRGCGTKPQLRTRLASRSCRSSFVQSYEDDPSFHPWPRRRFEQVRIASFLDDCKYEGELISIWRHREMKIRRSSPLFESLLVSAINSSLFLLVNLAIIVRVSVDLGSFTLSLLFEQYSQGQPRMYDP